MKKPQFPDLEFPDMETFMKNKVDGGSGKQASGEGCKDSPYTARVVGVRMEQHKFICPLLKKWKKVKKGTASREELDDEIVEFLDFAELDIAKFDDAVSSKGDDSGTLTIYLYGREIEVPFQGPPPPIIEKSADKVAGKQVAVSKVSGVRLDPAYRNVFLCDESLDLAEIPIPIHYFEKEGISTGLFEDILNSHENLPEGILPGKGNPFTEEGRNRLKKFFSQSGGATLETRSRDATLDKAQLVNR
jgi:hypothetical protein